MSVCRFALVAMAVLIQLSQLSAQPSSWTVEGRLAEYFAGETTRLQQDCLSDVRTIDDWEQNRERYRNELLEMLGLSPLPERTPLDVTITSTIEHDGFAVDQLHFQSRPGLYVTGNLYRPKQANGPLPAILYVCGHGRVKKGDVSYGNKTHYQHHGAWFAQNGYVCLTIDTLQLGEIEGIHHGTYRHDRWWWLNRGYTPAGVEAWNCVRALDYLCSRDDVDERRLGVTGRSGGGAYSWWIAAIDERIRCAVPVAGITDLTNHVVDGCVEGHCDCMFMVNTYRWDYAKVAALVAPRPLLISNTDTDRIFPLDGVYRIYKDVRRIYELHDAGDQVALHITAGGHKDTQELRVHAFRWFNRHLKDDDSLIRMPAEKAFEVEQLRVFDDLPEDEVNTTIDETFVAKTDPPKIQSQSDWNSFRDATLRGLEEKCFRGWPNELPPTQPSKAFSETSAGVELRAYDFQSQDAVDLKLYLAHRAGLQAPKLIVLNVLGEEDFEDFRSEFGSQFPKAFGKLEKTNKAAFTSTKQMFDSFDWVMAYVAPRGIGPSAWDVPEKKLTQLRRRFYLLGQSLDSMRVLDVRQAIHALRAGPFSETPLWLQGTGNMAGISLYASLFEPDIARLDLHALPASHREGPFFLNVSRVTDMPTTVALAAERSKVVLYDDQPQRWATPQVIANTLGWEKRFQVRKELD